MFKFHIWNFYALLQSLLLNLKKSYTYKFELNWIFIYIITSSFKEPNLQYADNKHPAENNPL